MDEYKIDDDVPLPPLHGRKATADRFPFAKLQIGQSFKIPLDDDDDTKERLRNRLFHHLKNFRREHPMIVLTSAWREANEEKDGIAGLRIWRRKDKS